MSDKMFHPEKETQNRIIPFFKINSNTLVLIILKTNRIIMISG